MRPPTPADSGSGGVGLPGQPGPAAGLLAAPLSEALAVLPGAGSSLADAGVAGGGCFARPLPADATCAAAARRFFREAVSSLGIPSGLVHDGVTMASELAANTLHAQHYAGPGAPRQLAPAGAPEIWVYLRGYGRTCELVCKVFDSQRGWNAGPTEGKDKAPADSVSGRGLQVVAALSAGQWGSHPTLSRLGSWNMPGKAVWFALRIPPSALSAGVGRPRLNPDWLVDELEAMLAERGLAETMVRADAEQISVLSISRHLTVWRHGSAVSWRAPSGRYQQMELADLVEATEQIVSAHEEAAQAEAVAV
jgi:hypothetical protein